MGRSGSDLDALGPPLPLEPPVTVLAGGCILCDGDRGEEEPLILADLLTGPVAVLLPADVVEDAGTVARAVFGGLLEGLPAGFCGAAGARAV